MFDNAKIVMLVALDLGSIDRPRSRSSHVDPMCQVAAVVELWQDDQVWEDLPAHCDQAASHPSWIVATVLYLDHLVSLQDYLLGFWTCSVLPRVSLHAKQECYLLSLQAHRIKCWCRVRDLNPRPSVSLELQALGPCVPQELPVILGGPDVTHHGNKTVATTTVLTRHTK